MSLQREEFEYVRELLQTNSGIVLEPGKEYLVETRLRALAEELKAPSVQELLRQLRNGSSRGTHQRVVEALTINETFFFRDARVFEVLQNTILPSIVERRRTERTLTIWSAACSTGQEPYSVAIILREHFPELASWGCRIIATDINEQVLSKAATGCYSRLEVNRGMPARLLAKYFSPNKLEWQLHADLRRMVEFRQLNLTSLWGLLPNMDIILLRNVLIYFDVAMKRRILQRMEIQIRPDGYLLLGSSEATFGLSQSFQRLANDKAGWHVVSR